MPGVTPYIAFNSAIDHSSNTSGNGELLGSPDLLTGNGAISNVQDSVQFGNDNFNALPAGGNAGAAVRLMFPTNFNTQFVDPPGIVITTDFDYASAIPPGEEIKGIELSFAPVHLIAQNLGAISINLNTGFFLADSRFSFTIQTHQNVATNLQNTVDITGDTATFTQNDQAGALVIPSAAGSQNPQVYRFTMGGPTNLLGLDTFIANINSNSISNPDFYTFLGQRISVIIHYDVSASDSDLNLTTFGKIGGAFNPDNLLGSTPAIRFYYDSITPLSSFSKMHILGNKVHILGNKMHVS